MAQSRDDRDPEPTYCYCTRNPIEPERGNPELILRSLVRQAASIQPSTPILRPTLDLHREREATAFAGGGLSARESIKLLIALSNSRPLTTIIIDALDECEPIKRDVLLDGLSEMLRSSKSLVKIMISSRDDRDIKCHLDDCDNIQIEANNNQSDIEHFVSVELDNLITNKRLLSGKVPDELRQQIEKVLSNEAQGMSVYFSLRRCSPVPVGHCHALL